MEDMETPEPQSQEKILSLARDSQIKSEIFSGKVKGIKVKENIQLVPPKVVTKIINPEEKWVEIGRNGRIKKNLQNINKRKEGNKQEINKKEKEQKIDARKERDCQKQRQLVSKVRAAPSLMQKP